MIIKSIELKNFRNYGDLQLSFDEGTNILYGDNAQDQYLRGCLFKRHDEVA